MHINRFRIEGYKSLKSAVWNSGGLNVLIGTNGSGKSNLLRALALLQQAAISQEFPKALLNQGGVQNILWDGKSQEIRWLLQDEPVGPFHVRAGECQRLIYELVIKPAFFLPSGYRISRERLSEAYLVGDKWQFEDLLMRKDESIEVFDENKKAKTKLNEKVPPDQTMLSLSPLSNPNMWFFRQNIETWGIYHDLQVHVGAQIRQAAVARVEKLVQADGQNLIPVLHTLYTTDRDFKKSVDAGMRAAFGDEYEEMVFAPAEDQKINLRVRWKSLSTTQPAADLSDGTIRFLLLLTILANPLPRLLIAIDEPEVGLHPSMLPIVAEFAAAAAENRTVILTTHSPQFLDAFKENAPTTTITRLVNGATEFSVLKEDKLARWLRDFSLGALFKSGELEEMD